MNRPIRYGALVAQLVVWCALVGVAGAAIGQATAGRPGLLGALAGAGLTVLFCASTALVMGLTRDKPLAVQSAWLVGSWLAKMVLLMAAFAVMGRGEWYSRPAFGVSVLVGVLGSLALDARVVLKSRVPPGGEC
jgi:hypothetical protein